ncbi:hypothetical protein SAMD00019534_041940 [Acytostelium subglobosum LB1]|uniref:hypothetical protein n=1 Tax=Acytostelium subglobosum LB1 TaxID=1410327 RepID=UPI000644A732|nr:hypothetical protein SAMD00019534_041940 [Acytostelium subglobosum LB1]GAM21019.1 hypothetical protein SAMD00019534_041940 [Acytostelium subglobosum LB1]|eukprot:XP_012756153.1 hypothetical protein SAMD00019534_041940 [Acytostelium subglobosum LB1]
MDTLDNNALTSILDRIRCLEEELAKTKAHNVILEDKLAKLSDKVDTHDLLLINNGSPKVIQSESSPSPMLITGQKNNAASSQQPSYTPASPPPLVVSKLPQQQQQQQQSFVHQTQFQANTNATEAHPTSPSPRISPLSPLPSESQNATPESQSPVLAPQQSHTPPEPSSPTIKESAAQNLFKRIIPALRAKKEPSMDNMGLYAPPSTPKLSKRSSNNYDEEVKGAGNDITHSQILKFQMPDLPENCEWAVVWEYSGGDDEWTRGVVAVQMEPKAFASGALRNAHKLHIRKNPVIYSQGFNRMQHIKYEENKRMNNMKLPRLFGPANSAYVAKISKTEVSAERYFEDVKMQMICKDFSQRYNENNPPKNIDFLSAWVIEIQKANGDTLLCGLEMFMAGEFKKQNSNFGSVFGDRNTPQAFSHFTHEASAHQLIVIDIQGVDDHYTDPQIHTKDGVGYGAGNLGEKGIEKFLKSHKCNPICIQLDLPPIGVDLADSRNITRVIRGTMALPDLIPDLDQSGHVTLAAPNNVTSSEMVTLGNLAGHTERITSLVVTNDGTRQLFSGAADGTMKIWNLDTLQCLDTIKAHRKAITAICYNQDNIFTSSLDQTIRVWDRKTNDNKAKLEEHTGEVNYICISNERNQLYSCSFDKSIRIWDLATLKCVKVLTAHSKSVKSLVISGKYMFSASNDETIKVWDLDMLVCIYGVSDAHEGWITSLALHNGLGAMISGSRDGTLKLWSLSTLIAQSTHEDNHEVICDILVTDRYVIVASEDTTIKIWDTVDVASGGTLKCVYSIKAHRSATCALATDGTRLFSGGGDNSIKYWSWKDK